MCKSLNIVKGGTMVHKIRELCKEKQISIAELERRAGVQLIRRWDEKEPSVYRVYRVAKILGTTVETLLEGDS